MQIPVLKPNPPDVSKWQKYIEMSYRQSIFSNGGPCVQLLEQRLKDYIGINSSPVLMSNATAALTVVLQAFDLHYPSELNPPEVLIPSFTFSATAHSVLNANCKPRLVDIDDDLQFSLESAEKQLSAYTRAMIVVQTLGFTCDYEKYQRFADKHELVLIFDSAAALGASYADGTKVGAAGDCEVFSLHVTKTFGIGEGGLVSSNNTGLLARCRQIANFGFVQGNNSECLGTNAKCSEFHAAVGLAVLDEIDQKIARKKERAAYYEKRLKKLGIQTLKGTNGYQVFPVIFANPSQKEAVAKSLAAHEIGSRSYYVPIHQQDYFRQYGIGAILSKTTDVASRILCIPFYETISRDEMDRVIEIIAEEI